MLSASVHAASARDTEPLLLFIFLKLLFVFLIIKCMLIKKKKRHKREHVKKQVKKRSQTFTPGPSLEVAFGGHVSRWSQVCVIQDGILSSVCTKKLQ